MENTGTLLAVIVVVGLFVAGAVWLLGALGTAPAWVLPVYLLLRSKD